MAADVGLGKFSPPLGPPGLVPRPRLVAALNDGARHPITLVSAGAGWGKTVLLGSWASAATMRTAWLSVDRLDNDPRRLWRMVGASLLTAGIVSGRDELAALPYDDEDGFELIDALLDSLPDSAESVLVLDDAHWLTDVNVLRQLEAVIHYGFPRLRLILGARSDPLLPLHRYRLAGQIAELRAADLAMTRAEAHALLAAHHVRLGKHHLDLLTQRTEGWAAGLRLSAMRMSGSRHPERFVTQLAIDRGSVGEYLIQEVLNQEPADVRRLLIQTSFLDEVDGSLAAAITGIETGSQVLAELARTTGFVVPIGRTGNWYRYHLLLLDVLRYLLRHEYPGMEQELRRSAAAWYRSRHDAAAAIRLAVAAEDWRQASEALVRGGLALAFVTREQLGARDFAESLAVIEPVARPDPVIDLAQAAAAVASGNLDSAKERLTAVRATELDGDEAVTADLVEVLAAHQAGAVADLDEAAEAILRRRPVPASAGLGAALRLAQATTRYWNGDSNAKVERLLLDAIAYARQEGVVALELEALGALQLMHTGSGRFERAKDCETQSLTLIRENPTLDRTAAHHLARAQAAHLRLDLGAAERAAHRAEQGVSPEADRPMQAAVALMKARILITMRRLSEAHQLLTSGEELGAELPPKLLRNRDYLLALIAIQTGRPRDALEILGEDPTRSANPLVAIIAARAHLALDDPQAARRCLRPGPITDESAMPFVALIQSALTVAATAAQSGDDVTAVNEILRACELAGARAPQPFAESYELLSGVLARHPEARAVWPRAAIGSERDGYPPVAVPVATGERLLEPLTDRELAVLRRLATTMTTQEIAQELRISINTVKTHIAAIYRKLPAANRREATTRARQLELL